ncbi:hypothetical protein WN944_028225 [Citrus x changshan-huyou]|uniref:Uncharacterized protein n=1 Tax=Citrus x changshan-huyou TaxID=2935761 RepID=A0AAP0QDQ5_9ROSI
MAAHLGAPPPDFLSSTAAEIDEFVRSSTFCIRRRNIKRPPTLEKLWPEIEAQET